MQLSRRGFIKITAAGLAASSLGALGFGGAGEALAASVRPFKLTAATETRNTCTYCSVAEAVDEDAASDGAIGAGVAGLRRRGQLEGPHRCSQSFPIAAKTKSAQARCGKSRCGDLDESATTELHGDSPDIAARYSRNPQAPANGNRRSS